MVYRKIENENGLYQSGDGSLYIIMEATKVATPQGINVGWDTFDNIEEAAAHYELAYIGPEPEPEPVPEPEVPVMTNELFDEVLKRILEEEIDN